MTEPLELEVKHLSVSFQMPFGEVQAVRDASFCLHPGEVLAIVGESGCGKSVLCKSILKLLPASAKIRSDGICLCGTDISGYGEREMCRLRGKTAAMILQDAMASLNPTMRVGAQIAEAVRVHQPLLSKQSQSSIIIEEKVEALLQLVGIDPAAEKKMQYPYQFSGGMRQRVVLAAALAADPRILFADEPTTALDVLAQAKILDLLDELRQKLGMAVVFVTHDLGAAARLADRIVVMHDGKIVETGTAEEIYHKPKHPYTCELLRCLPVFSKRKTMPPVVSKTPPLVLDVRHLSYCYTLGKHEPVQAVRDVSFQICKGEVFGLIGASGCGKSKVARCIMNLYKPDSGSIFYQGMDSNDPKIRRGQRRIMQQTRQMIFQDTGASLNPRMKVCDLITEPMKIHRIKPKEGSYRSYAALLMNDTGLDERYLDAYPSALSGGMRQRVVIARALSMEPQLLVADEPIASLDVSMQAQIVRLFQYLQKERGFSFLFISHDLSVVELLCDRAGVMYRGRLVECAPVEELFAHPLHPYTRSLLSAIPVPDPAKEQEKKQRVFWQEEIDSRAVWTQAAPGHFVLE